MKGVASGKQDLVELRAEQLDNPPRMFMTRVLTIPDGTQLGMKVVVLSLTDCTCMSQQCERLVHMPLEQSTAHAMGMMLLKSAAEAGYKPPPSAFNG